MAEEFRLLTLQVIAEAILSLTPEQSDEVMPISTYLSWRNAIDLSLEPWRKFCRRPSGSPIASAWRC